MEFLTRSTSLLLSGFMGIAMLVASGCANIPPTSYPPPAPVTINDSVAGVWPAIIDVITERQLPIQTVDRASGLVQTEIIRSHAIEWWDCGRYGQTRASIAENEGVYVVLTISAVPRGGTQTQLRVGADPRVSTASGAPCNSRGQYEREFIDQVVARWRELSGNPAAVAATPTPAYPTEPVRRIERFTRLTGCGPDGTAQMLVELRSRADGQEVTGRLNVRGNEDLLCLGPEVFVREGQLVRGVQWYYIEHFETGAVGWVPERFIYERPLP